MKAHLAACGCLSLFHLLLCSLASAEETDLVADARWKKQFEGAVKWSSLGVADDSGATDNTAAHNALPVNKPIIGDISHQAVGNLLIAATDVCDSCRYVAEVAKSVIAGIRHG